MTQTDWDSVGTSLATECPSRTYRELAAGLLTKCESLGPLAGASRTPADEFRRVYKFLHYNEPHRLNEVVDELLTVFQRRNSDAPAERNAWNYAVGSYDRWIVRARVVYLAGGLLEGTLRSRLNARMTDAYGPEWFKDVNCVPSSVNEQIAREAAQSSLATVQRILDERGKSDDRDEVIETLRLVNDAIAKAAPRTPNSGADFVGHLTFGQLRSFFQAKKLWSKGPKLEQLFTPQKGENSPLLKSTVDAELAVIQDFRNDVAHYRAKPSSRFSPVLYSCAKVARWLDVDLQHFYSAVDTRMSTELSILVDEVEALRALAGDDSRCSSSGCHFQEPLDVLLDTAPRSREELGAPNVAHWACQYHRVQLRRLIHRAKES